MPSFLSFVKLLLLSLLLFLALFQAPAQAQLDYRLWDSQADAAYDRGSYDTALWYWQKSLSLALKQFQETDTVCAELSINLGATHFQLGAYAQAEAYFRLALSAYEALPFKHPKQINVMNNLGVLYAELGRYAEAEAIYKEVSSLLKTKAFGDRPSDLGNNFNNLGSLYARQEQFELALPYLKQALEIWFQFQKEKPRYYAYALNNLAGLYYRMGQYHASLQMYIKAEERYQAVLGKTHPQYANLLSNLALMHHKVGDTLQAQKLLHQTLYLQRENLSAPRHPHILTSLNLIARFYFDLGQRDSAAYYLAEALAWNLSENQDTQIRDLEKIAQILAKRPIFASPIQGVKSLHLLFEWYAQEAQYENQSEAVLDWALNFFDTYRSSFTIESDKLIILREHSKLLELGLNHYAKRLETLGDKIYKVLDLAERGRSILLAESLRASKARTFGGLPDSLSKQEAALQERLALAKKKLLELSDTQELMQWQQKLREAQEEAHQFQQMLASRYPRYHEHKYTRPHLDYQALQARLPKNVALISFVVRGERLLAFVLSRRGLVLRVLDNTDQLLQKNIDAYHKALFGQLHQDVNTKPEDFIPWARALYRQLLEPLEADLAFANHWVILPDGPLDGLSLDALLYQDVEAGTDLGSLPYLLKHKTLSYAQSLHVLESFRQTERKEAIKQELLAIAPNYEPLKEDLIQHRPLHLVKLRQKFKPLLGVFKEVEGLAKLMPSKVLLREEASERNFRALAGDYDVLHIAGHGWLDRTYPMLSSMVLSEDGDSLQDNFLQAYEISQMELAARLVVLSGCETGLGTQVAGEGSLSLARSFGYAGVPATVVSLWPVNDQATQWLMTDFYTHLVDGKDKAEALRLSKLSYLTKAKGQASHPAYWAAFVLQGDWSPLRTSWSWAWYVALFLGPLALGLGAYAWLRTRRPSSVRTA